MDGNRRYARSIGQPVIVGHQHGAQTAANVLEWWLRFMPNTATYTHPGPGPRYLTIWVFSSENFKRPKEEVDGLFRLMTVLFKNLAFSSAIHPYSKSAFASSGAVKDLRESYLMWLTFWRRPRGNTPGYFSRLRWAMADTMRLCIQCRI